MSQHHFWQTSANYGICLLGGDGDTVHWLWCQFPVITVEATLWCQFPITRHWNHSGSFHWDANFLSQGIGITVEATLWCQFPITKHWNHSGSNTVMPISYHKAMESQWKQHCDANFLSQGIGITVEAALWCQFPITRHWNHSGSNTDANFLSQGIGITVEATLWCQFPITKHWNHSGSNTVMPISYHKALESQWKQHCDANFLSQGIGITVEATLWCQFPITKHWNHSGSNTVMPISNHKAMESQWKQHCDANFLSQGIGITMEARLMPISHHKALESQWKQHWCQFPITRHWNHSRSNTVMPISYHKALESQWKQDWCQFPITRHWNHSGSNTDANFLSQGIGITVEATLMPISYHKALESQWKQDWCQFRITRHWNHSGSNTDANFLSQGIGITVEAALWCQFPITRHWNHSRSNTVMPISYHKALESQWKQDWCQFLITRHWNHSGSNTVITHWLDPLINQLHFDLYFCLVSI